MLQIELTEDLESRLTQLARESGLNAKDWATTMLKLLVEHREIVEDLEDIIAADKIRKAIDSGEEETFTLDQVKRELGI